MGGHRCCSKQKVKRGLWSPEEDEKLARHITSFGHGSWSSVPKLAGLQRCGKSCRLRWINYLRPDLKKGSFTQEEEHIIIDVHRILGNRWAQIAKHLPGRTDNEVKNFWNSCVKKKLMSQGLDPQTHNLISSRYNQRGTVKNSATSFVVSHENRHEQEPIPAFSMSSSSHEIITNDIGSSEDRQFLPNPPFRLTLPGNAQTTVDDQHRKPNVFQNYGAISTPNVSSSSSSLDVQNLSCFVDRDFCIWGSGFEPFDQTPRLMEGYSDQLSVQVHPSEYDHHEKITQMQQKDEISEMRNENITEKNSSSSFDLGYLESALMSDVMGHDLSSVEYDDQISWNY